MCSAVLATSLASAHGTRSPALLPTATYQFMGGTGPCAPSVPLYLGFRDYLNHGHHLNSRSHPCGHLYIHLVHLAMSPLHLMCPLPSALTGCHVFSAIAVFARLQRHERWLSGSSLYPRV